MENTKNTALLVMDMQQVIVGMLPNADALIANVAKAISAARNNQIPVIYVVVGFRPGMPEVSANNKTFAASKERFSGIDPGDFLKITPQLTPAEGEVIVTKRRVSAFTGSDLEVILRAQNIQHIVLTGISTSGVVLSTVREAADKDYRITVLADGCADPEEENHRVLTTNIFPRQCQVMNVGEWV
jgi:nicotinamidase-related amidase